eukprot:1550992-Amphidinium_carterae.1
MSEITPNKFQMKSTSWRSTFSTCSKLAFRKLSDQSSLALILEPCRLPFMQSTANASHSPAISSSNSLFKFPSTSFCFAEFARPHGGSRSRRDTLGNQQHPPPPMQLAKRRSQALVTCKPASRPDRP